MRHFYDQLHFKRFFMLLIYLQFLLAIGLIQLALFSYFSVNILRNQFCGIDFHIFLWRCFRIIVCVVAYIQLFYAVEFTWNDNVWIFIPIALLLVFMKYSLKSLDIAFSLISEKFNFKVLSQKNHLSFINRAFLQFLWVWWRIYGSDDMSFIVSKKRRRKITQDVWHLVLRTNFVLNFDN
jgi:hypothetical protein